MSNYKIKSSRAILKRFKITPAGKCLRHKAGRSHLLQKKTSKRKHYLRKVVSVKHADRSLFRSKILALK